MSRRKRTLQSKFVAVAALGIFGGLALSVGVSVVGARRLSELSSKEIERGLTDASRELVEKQLDDTGRAIERLIGPTIAELHVAVDYAQNLIDHQEEYAPLLEAAKKIPALRPEMRFVPAGKMSQNPAGHPTTIAVWDSMLDPQGRLPANVDRLVDETSLIDLVISPIQKNGTNKLQVYYIGPQDRPLIRMAPAVDIAAVWYQLYPAASKQPFWQYFFPGVVEYWQAMIADKERFEKHNRDVLFWPPYEDAAGGGKIVTIFRPLWSKDRSASAGAIGIDITLNQIAGTIEQVRLGLSGFAFLMEDDGNILAINEAGAKVLNLRAEDAAQPGLKMLIRNLSKSSEPGVASLKYSLVPNQETQIFERTIGQEKYLFAFRRHFAFDIARGEKGVTSEHWTLGVVVPHKEIYGPLLASQRVIEETSYSVIIAQVIITGLTLVAVLFGILITTRKLTAPLSNLTRAAREIQQRNYAVSVPESNTDDEIDELTTAFNAMAAESREHTQNLETLVAQRTSDLNRTVADLWSEMDLARKIQTVLLPNDALLLNYDVAATMHPASDVGGDYYDFFGVGEAQWLLIGDVSGHGVSSGLIMMMAQTAVRATTRSLSKSGVTPAPSEVLSMVNIAIRSNLQKIGGDQYMTVNALRLEADGVRYAGLHQDMLVYRAALKTVERVETSGVWVGLLDDISPFLSDAKLEMKQDDVLLLYTDGLTEERSNGAMVGVEALERALFEVASQKSTSKSIIEDILKRMPVQTFKDDVTLIAVTRR